MIKEKLIKPDLTINDIKDLDVDYLKEIGINGLILDVDETLRFSDNDISDDVINWLINMKKEMKICVVSDGYSLKVKDVLDNLDIPYFSFSFKPLKRNFKKAIKYMNIDNYLILTVGDDLVADILGGKRNKTRTCLVKKID